MRNYLGAFWVLLVPAFCWGQLDTEGSILGNVQDSERWRRGGRVGQSHQ